MRRAPTESVPGGHSKPGRASRDPAGSPGTRQTEFCRDADGKIPEAAKLNSLYLRRHLRTPSSVMFYRTFNKINMNNLAFPEPRRKSENDLLVTRSNLPESPAERFGIKFRASYQH